MEPQENRKLALGKAINAHEQAEAALNDLRSDVTDPRYHAMVARIHQNLLELRADAAAATPDDHV
ncbi:MAG: hypothetical protein KY467_06590 [Gemmatimonadetes bacterium]|nr:hypothetical protein [Gemmatimonadota bacterium]